MSKYHKAAWNEESRQRQHEVIMKRKPWLKSTGAKTAEGKERSKMNALKTDPHLYVLMKEMDSIMKQQKEIFNAVSKTTVIYSK